MRRPRSFFSGEAFFVKPTGSQRSRGTGCGILNWSPASGLLNEGKAPGLAALGVVSAGGAALGEELEEADEEDDLPLARLGHLIPKLRGRLRGVVAGDVDRELHAVRVEAVADEAGHGDAAVLDLGVAQPADGVLVAAAPEVRVGEAERVVETDDRVELDREGLKVGLGLLDLDRGAGRRRSDERRGDREAGESDGELHFVNW